MWRKDVIHAMSAVEREYRAAARAAVLLQQQCKDDPGVLNDAAVTPDDVRQHVRHDDLSNAHLVREYRNAVVHGGDADRVSLPQARVFLCTFFGWMPKQW